MEQEIDYAAMGGGEDVFVITFAAVSRHDQAGLVFIRARDQSPSVGGFMGGLGSPVSRLGLPSFARAGDGWKSPQPPVLRLGLPSFAR